MTSLASAAKIPLHLFRFPRPSIVYTLEPPSHTTIDIDSLKYFLFIALTTQARLSESASISR